MHTTPLEKPCRTQRTPAVAKSLHAVWGRLRAYISPLDVLLCGATLALCAGLAALAPHLPADEPRALLAPVAWLCRFWTGASFALIAGQGYHAVSALGLPVSITSACSGVRFFIMLAALLVCVRIPRTRASAKPLAWLACLALAYAAAIAATALRISATLLIARPGAWPDAVLLHNLLGITAYLTAMLACYSLARQWPASLSCARRVEILLGGRDCV